jgi:hypothetical protein
MNCGLTDSNIWPEAAEKNRAGGLCGKSGRTEKINCQLYDRPGQK